jgi:hypothetical protein
MLDTGDLNGMPLSGIDAAETMGENSAKPLANARRKLGQLVISDEKQYISEEQWKNAL